MLCATYLGVPAGVVLVPVKGRGIASPGPRQFLTGKLRERWVVLCKFRVLDGWRFVKRHFPESSSVHKHRERLSSKLRNRVPCRRSLSRRPDGSDESKGSVFNNLGEGIFKVDSVLFNDAPFGRLSPPDHVPRMENPSGFQSGKELDESRKFVNSLDVFIVGERTSEMRNAIAAGSKVPGHWADDDDIGPNLL